MLLMSEVVGFIRLKCPWQMVADTCKGRWIIYKICISEFELILNPIDHSTQFCMSHGKKPE